MRPAAILRYQRIPSILGQISSYLERIQSTEVRKTRYKSRDRSPPNLSKRQADPTAQTAENAAPKPSGRPESASRVPGEPVGACIPAQDGVETMTKCGAVMRPRPE